MKGKLITILALIGAVILGVLAFRTPDRVQAIVLHQHCVCGTGTVNAGSHTTCETVTWDPWTSTTSLPTETGYYYLTDDVHITGPAAPAAGTSVKLCLAGHKVYMDGNERIIRLTDGANTKYLVTNCGDRDDGQLVGKCVYDSGAQGGVFWSNKSGSEIDLFNVVVDGSQNKSGYGCAITVEGNGALRIWDSKILGGTTTNSSIAGGAIVAVGTVEINGSELSGGTGAKGGVLWFKAQTASVIQDTTISGGSASTGGNVSVEGGTVRFVGCTITGGTATAGNGGNIYVTAGTVTIENSTVSDGTVSAANKFGGNIAMASTGTVTIDGVNSLISGGTAPFAGSIYVNGTLYLKSGTVTGGTATRTSDGGGNIGTDGSGKFYMTGGTVSGGKADKGGNIFNYGLLSITGGTVSGGQVTNWAGNIAIYSNKDNVIGGTAVIEAPVNFENIFINSGGMKLTMTGGTVRNSPWTNVRVYGQSGSENGYFYFQGGEIYMDDAYTTGHNVKLWGYMEMTGGTIRDSKVTESGCNIRGSDQGSRTAPSGISDEKRYLPYFKMTAGTISGGTAKNYGGNIYWHLGAMDIAGGTITGGKSTNIHGGNIYIDGGTANFTGGTVSYGDAKQYGGNLAIDGTGATVNISDDAVFIGGNSGNGTGSTPNIYANQGTLTITGGTFINPDDKENALWYSSNMTVSVEGGYFTRIYGQKGDTLSGGYLFEKPADSYLKTDYAFVSDNASVTVESMTKTFGYAVIPESEVMTVSLTSEAVLGSMPVAALSGGGRFRIDTDVSVSAPDVPGYRFLGWYYGSSFASSEQNAVLSTLGMGDVLMLTARYEYGPATGFAVTVNGTSDYTISGTTVGTKYAVGTDVTVSYTGTGTFEGWVNGGGKLMSRDAEYTFTVSGDTELTANIASATEPLVIFYTATKQVYKARVISDTAENKLTDADFATVPAVTGKKNGRWTVGGTVVTTVAELTAKIGSAQTANVNATYDADDTATYTLTVTGVEAGAMGYPSTWTAYTAGDQLFENVNVNDSVTLNAENGAKTFRYYADALGNVLSTAAATNVRYRENTTIYAVYGDSAYTAAKPTVTMITARRDGTTLYFEALRCIPAGYTVKEQGILFGTAAGLTYGADGVYKYVSNGQGANDVTGLTLKNIDSSMTIYAAGYVIFTDGTAEGIIYTGEEAK